MRATLICVTLCATPSLADSTRTWSAMDHTGRWSHSAVTLGPPEAPGAVATVTFDNRQVHGPDDNGQFSLTHEGMTVSARFWWQSGGERGADAITLSPPPGYAAIPVDLEVPENEIGKAHIYQWEGM